jgi:crotonobetainyl-CoA:carnitine CoA-transferase CaiB-like acyl-CoA transferase
VGALSHVRVIELAEGVAGEHCGRLLADFGAEVVKIERPSIGSPTRAMAPVGSLFAYLNTNKRSVVLDLSVASDVERLHRLIATADAVIDDHPEAWLAGLGLGASERDARHLQAVFCAIRRFGAGAPEDWSVANTLNVFHASGWGYHTPSAPDPARPPLMGAACYLADYEAGLDGALCVAAGLFRRGRIGRGQSVEVSQLEVLVSRADAVVGRFLAGDDEPGDARDAYDLNGPTGSFPCRDGFIYLVVLHRGHWAALRELLGAPAWMNDFPEDWLEFGVTPERNEAFRRGFGDWVRTRSKQAVCEAGQALDLPIAPVNDAADLLRSPQFQHRRFFTELGKALYPRTPYKLSATPVELVGPAPGVGQHTERALEARVAPLPQPSPRPPPDATRGGPLAGVRVLEIAKVWAGPHAGKILAFLGAEVVKVESRSALDEMRLYGGVDPDRAPYFQSVNPEVLSVQVNMKSPKGLALLRDMAAKSDIVLESLRPGAMERLGLGYEALRAIRPDIISVSLKMYGNDGPLGHETGYAPCFAALGGLNYLVGYEGEPPAGVNVRYGDTSAGVAAVFAALVALLHRERTGESQFVDLSAVETMASLVGESLLEYSLTGQIPVAHGDRHPVMAPHGCYPCKDGTWISLALSRDEEWTILCDVLDAPELAHAARFSSDAELSVATRAHDASDIAARLRARGVPAFKSETSLDVVSNSHLWEHGFFRLVSDAASGSRPIVGAPWRFSESQASITRGAPRLGEHNAYVYGELLGLSREELERLIRDGVVD